MNLDTTDVKIINTLIEDGRASVEAVAERVGLSPTPTRRRIKRLEEDRVITAYRAEVDPVQAGLEISIHVLVKLQTRDRETIEQFEKIVKTTPEIQRCDLVTGQYDYILLIHLPSMKDYHRYLRQFLENNIAVGSIESNVVIGKIKGSALLAVPAT
ncbi:MAG: Lrp/AsnC family transcriptional regulator [Granulosicoccus sp.]|nr:Lrp/AsnC family transcriptional regulator [Granulosicoccus sp.]